MSLLTATKTIAKSGRKVSRRWVSSPELLKVMRHESSYAHRARNKEGACGLGQMLPCDKFGPGSCWPQLVKQAECMVRYIVITYKNPAAAWAHWQRFRWY